MVHFSIIEARLSKLGVSCSRWFKPEIRELQHILMDDEEIVACAQGRYFGGFALLVATDHRLLLIDKKIPYLTVEDIRYDMIAEIDYGSSIYDATINIYTVNKQFKFSSWKHKHHLRKLVAYAQRRVMELRHYQQQGPPDATQSVSNAPSLKGLGLQQDNKPEPAASSPVPAMPSSEPQASASHPSSGVSQVMGATAVGAAHKWANPYTRNSLVMRRQWSRSS